MNIISRWLVMGAVAGCCGLALRAQVVTTVTTQPATPASPAPPVPPVQPDSSTEGTVTVGGQAIAYRAVAGTLTVGGTDQQDAMLGLDGKLLADTGEKPLDPAKPDEAPATARMFYVAYFKKGAPSESRPVMFLYNGGPGSSSMWLHMGAFGPRRVSTTDTQHDPAAP